MQDIDLEYICSVIGNLSGIPIRVYENGKRTFFYSVVRLPVDPICLYEERILATDAHIGYYIAPSFHYYGVVTRENTKIVIGPSIQMKCSDADLKSLAFACDVPADEVAEFVAGINSIVQMPLDSTLQILCTINYILNGENWG